MRANNVCVLAQARDESAALEAVRYRVREMASEIEHAGEGVRLLGSEVTFALLAKVVGSLGAGLAAILRVLAGG